MASMKNQTRMHHDDLRYSPLRRGGLKKSIKTQTQDVDYLIENKARMHHDDLKYSPLRRGALKKSRKTQTQDVDHLIEIRQLLDELDDKNSEIEKLKLELEEKKFEIAEYQRELEHKNSVCNEARNNFSDRASYEEDVECQSLDDDTLVSDEKDVECQTLDDGTLEAESDSKSVSLPNDGIHPHLFDPKSFEHSFRYFQNPSLWQPFPSLMQQFQPFQETRDFPAREYFLQSAFGFNLERRPMRRDERRQWNESENFS